MGLLSRWSQMRPDRLGTVFADGVAAGGIGGALVLAVFTLYDLTTAEFLRTPSVLHALFLEGPEAAAATDADTERAVSYTFVHFVLWFGVGIAAAYSVVLTRVYPAFWYLAVIGPTVTLVLFVSSAGVWGVPGLGVHHLWVGALLGGTAVTGYFAWRHPGWIRPAS